MMFRNATLFRFPTSLDLSALDARLAECTLKPVGALELSSCGFVSPFGRDAEALSHRIGDAIWLSVGREEKMLPGSVVNDLLAKKLDEIEQREGRKPGGRARKRIKEDLVHELLPRAFVKPGRTDALLDVAGGWCIVDTSSRKAAESVVSEIRHALGSFPALPVNAEVAPRSVLTGWIAGEPLPAGLSIGDECELRDAASGGAVVRCQRQEMHSDEIEKHLESGKQVTRLALSLGDHVSFVLGEDMVIRKVKLLDGAVDALESTERDDVRAELDARFALFSAEMRGLLGVLEPALKLSRVDDEPPEEFMRAARKLAAAGISPNDPIDANATFTFGDDTDPLYPEAVRVVREKNRASISMVQRILKLGYNRAARLIETMEAQGVVTAPDYAGERKVCAVTAMDV